MEEKDQLLEIILWCIHICLAMCSYKYVHISKDKWIKIIFKNLVSLLTHDLRWYVNFDFLSLSGKASGISSAS